MGRAPGGVTRGTVTRTPEPLPRGIQRPRLAELLRGPRGRRMRRDVHVDHAASVVGQDDEHEQHAEGGGRDREEVDRRELGDMIREERPPRLRRRLG